MSDRKESRILTLNFIGRPIDLAFWLKMIVLIIVLLVVPLEFNYYEAVQPFPASNYYDIFISSAMMEYVDYPSRGDPTPVFSSPLTLASAIIICIPAIILNRRIRNLDRTKSIRDIALASLFSTGAAAVYLVEYFPPGDLAWLIQTAPEWKLMRFGSLVIMVLILIPIMLREVPHRALQRRHKILAYSIAPISILVPAGIIASFPRDYANYQVGSAFYQFWYQRSIPVVPWQQADQVYIGFNILPAMDLFYIFTYIGLHLLFGFFILRYLQGLASKRRVFLLGALSILFPSVLAYQLIVANNPIPAILIPVPILFIVGISVLAVMKPICPSTVSADSREEKNRGMKESESSISVPFLYVLKSKLLRVRRRIGRQEDES